MKFSALVNDLQYALKACKDAIKASSDNQEDAAITLVSYPGRVEFFADSENLKIKATIIAQVEEPGIVSVDCASFYSFISKLVVYDEERNYGTESVQFSVAQKGKILAAVAKVNYPSGASVPQKRNFNLTGIKSIPKLPELKELPRIPISAALLSTDILPL